MSTSVSFNGSTYTIPATGEQDWGGTSKVDGFLIAVASNALSKVGGSFTLTAEVDFGATYGVKAAYYKSEGSNISSAGILRMASTESIGWRNNANNANLLLTTDASDNLLYNGTIIHSSAGLVPVASGGTNIASYTTGDILYASGSTTLSKLAIGSANKVLVSTGTAPSWATIVDANVNASAAIAYSKLALTGAILNADLAGSIAASKLVGSDIATVGTITSGTWSGTTIAIAKGGTGATTAIAGFNALSPLTTKGDLIGTNSTTAARVAVGADATVLTADSSATNGFSWQAVALFLPGMLMPYAGSVLPAGWLACDGTAVSRTTYSSLFTAISTTWGAGNGTTTFNVPDLRGRTLINEGTGSGLTARTLGTQNIGEETHVLTTTEMPSHTHSQPTILGNSYLNSGSGTAWGTNPSTTGSTGGDVAHNTMQPSAVVKYMIKT